MNWTNLPQALRLLRERSGLNQTQLAAKIRAESGDKITASRLSLWETGRALPSLNSLAAVLTGLGASLRDLEDTMDAIEPMVEAAAASAQRRLEIDPTLRVRFLRLVQLLDDYQGFKDLVQWVEQLQEEPNGTDS